MYRKPYSKQCVWVSDVSLYFSHALSSWLRTGEAYSTESPCQNYKCLGQDCSTIYPVLVYSPTSCLLSCGLFLCHLLSVLANSIDTTGSKSMHVIMLDLFERQRKENTSVWIWKGSLLLFELPYRNDTELQQVEINRWQDWWNSVDQKEHYKNHYSLGQLTK